MLDEEKGTVRQKWRIRYGMEPFLAARENILIRGDGEVTVYGCRKILLYSPEEIRLRLCKKELSVMGRGLYCACFSCGSVTVRGHVLGVLYRDGDALNR